MVMKTFLHLDHSMTMVSKEELLNKMMENGSGIMKPEKQSSGPHTLLLKFDEEKIRICDIPHVAEKFGVKSEVFDF